MIKLNNSSIQFPDILPHIERKKSTLKEAGYTKIGDRIVRRNVDYVAQAGMQEMFGTIDADVIFAGGQPGGGKGHPLDYKIATPFGLRRLGDLKVGSIISGSDGCMQKIIQIHELGERDVYRLKFADGTHCDCTEDHLWKVKRMSYQRKSRKINSTGADKDWQIADMKAIMNYLGREDKKYNIAIPLGCAVKFSISNKKLRTIDPYILGLLLGDGCLTYTCYSILYSSVDKEIVKSFEDNGIEMRNNPNDQKNYRCHNNTLVSRLRKLKLIGTRSETKFIPECYKTASIEDRISILQGLMDSDGFASKDAKSGVYYTTVSYQLAKDVQSIIFSLGGRATITKGKSAYTNKYGESVKCLDHYDVYIQTQDNTKLFRLERKRERVRSYNNGSSELSRRISGFEYVGKSICRCITVSNPDSLYMAGDNYVLTHNSFGLMIEAARGVGAKGYNAIIVKKELVSTKVGGGSIVDFAKQIYLDWGGCSFTSAENPTFSWIKSFSSIQFTHANFEGNTEKSIKDAQEKMKNKQASFIGIDELTDFPFTTFNYFFTRNRDDSGVRPRMICTFNTNGWHFTRTMIDWYIDEDNYVIPERLGKIRYFILNGDTENDFVWGNTKEEVLAQIDVELPEEMRAFGMTKEDLVKSFTFIPCKMMDNELMMHSTKGAHIANVFNAGASEQKKLFYGYWGETERGSYQLTDEDIMAQFTTAGEGDDNQMYITADIGDGGDPSIAVVWRGLTKISREINYTDDAQLKITWLREIMDKYKVRPQQVAYDGQAIGNYINDFLLDTIPIISNSSARPLATYDTAGNKSIATTYNRLIDQLMDRLVALHQSRRIKCTIDPNMPIKYGRKGETMKYKDVLCTEKALFVRYETETGKVHYESKTVFKKKYGYSPDDTDCEKYRMIWELNTKDRKEIEPPKTRMDFMAGWSSASSKTSIANFFNKIK